ncbi:MAG: S41 family peptidase, partial [Bacteroidota bacterium]
GTRPEVGQVIAQFGDGHSRVRKLSRMLDPGFLPFAVSAYQNQVVCLSAEGAKLLHPQYPYLDAVNGLSVDSLLRLSRRFTADGSPQFVRFRSVELLAYIQFFLQLGEADQGSQLLVRLRNDQGKTKEIQTTLSEKPIWPPQLPAGDALLEENIGYLRLPSMSGSDPRLEKLPERMARFKDTRGLIIDVRGNGGGSRKALMTLAPYFLKPDQGPIVGNAAVFRTEDTSFPEEGYLSRRFMYPEKSGKYAPTALQAIATFKESFRPQWQFDEAQFSPWHYLVLSPQPETVPFLYEKPVVILMDAFCFSATDIFLAAMGEIAGITLMGTASGGGSGFSKTYELPHSGIEVSLSRMASFQPNGQMYDGVGVQPDIPISPDLEEVTGQRDGTLEEARAFILHQP